jgi:hypothetical protein
VNQNKNKKFINENFETITVDRNLGNLKYIVHNFQINYQQIPFFEFFSPYEFSSKINQINNICSH